MKFFLKYNTVQKVKSYVTQIFFTSTLMSSGQNNNQVYE